MLVTIDSDFRTRWIKSGLLQSCGAEVIVFTQDLKGPREQHSRIVKHIPHWLADLAAYPYGFRVWQQTQNARPSIVQGPKKRVG